MQWFKNCLSENISENSDKQNSDKSAAAINDHIAHGSTAALYKKLVKFVQSSKAGAQDACGQHKPDAANAIDIQRYGDGHCKQEIFREMGDFSYIKVDFLNTPVDLLFGKL